MGEAEAVMCFGKCTEFEKYGVWQKHNIVLNVWNIYTDLQSNASSSKGHIIIRAGRPGPQGLDRILMLLYHGAITSYSWLALVRNTHVCVYVSVYIYTYMCVLNWKRTHWMASTECSIAAPHLSLPIGKRPRPRPLIDHSVPPAAERLFMTLCQLVHLDNHLVDVSSKHSNQQTLQRT